MNDVFDQALQRLLADEPLARFCDWFAPAMAASAQATVPVAPADAAGALRYQRHVARQLWGRMPVPANRWRARGVPKVERNAPCHCGSGRKYKQCCAEFEHMALPLEPDQLLAMALENAEPRWLQGDALRQVPAHALAHAASIWNGSDRTGQTVAVLGALFEQARGLDERHEEALDLLLDALRLQGLERQRLALMERMAQHPDKALATTARSRWVTVLADRGEVDQSWKLFHETVRLNPGDPQLWPLEMSLLLLQGRHDEARLRAPLLAARARQAGMDELAETLLDMAREGLAGAYDLNNDTPDHEDDLAWIALAEATPAAPDTAALPALYRVERMTQEHNPQERSPQIPDDAQPDDTATDDAEPKSGPVAVVDFGPTPEQARLTRRWQQRFVVGKPDLTGLDADVDDLLDHLPEALAFLREHPAAWLNASVLDDLLLAGYALCDPNAPRAVLRATQRVAEHAVAVLRALVGDAECHWARMDHRPLLRCLAVAVELQGVLHDPEHALALMRWGLAMNPHDNLGWRRVIAPLLVGRDHLDEALALLARYPDDMPPSEHVRALTLFALGRRDEAEAVLRAAHLAYPLFLQWLLPEAVDAPTEDYSGPGILIDGATAAWLHRQKWRAHWTRLGALAWARALALPDPPPPAPPPERAPRRARRSDQPAKKYTQGMAALNAPVGEREHKRLGKTCSDLPRLYGFMVGVVWSPQLLMASHWLSDAVDLHDRMPNSRTEATAKRALQDVAGLTMRLYNHANQQVLDQLDQPAPPLRPMLDPVVDGDAAACAWAAGFVAGCEKALAAWARTGHKVTGDTGPFGRLRGLAARAPVAPGQPRLEQADGSPMLQLLGDTLEPAAELAQALTELWPVVRADRRGAR